MDKAQIAKATVMKVADANAISSIDVNKIVELLVDCQKYGFQKRVELLQQAAPEINRMACQLVDTFDKAVRIGITLDEKEYDALFRIIIENPKLTDEQIKMKLNLYTDSINKRTSSNGKELRKNIITFGGGILMFGLSIATMLLSANSGEISKQIGKTKRTQARMNGLFWNKK